MDLENNSCEVRPEPCESYETCKRCGNTYSSLLKACPVCHNNPTEEHYKGIVKASVVTAIIMLLVTIAVFSIMTFAELNTKVAVLENGINEINETLDGFTVSTSAQTAETEDVDITTLQYYDDQLITEDVVLEDLEEDYLIFARQDGCHFCEEAEKYIYDFLYYGYPDYIPIYFITPNSNESIFFDTLNCEGTPVLYRMNKGTIVEQADGAEGAAELLNKIVEEANKVATSAQN